VPVCSDTARKVVVWEGCQFTDSVGSQMIVSILEWADTEECGHELRRVRASIRIKDHDPVPSVEVIACPHTPKRVPS
jgi:hypothetical protein